MSDFKETWSYLSTAWGRMSGISAVLPFPVGVLKWIPETPNVKPGFVGGITMIVAFVVIGMVVSNRLDILESPQPRRSLDRQRTRAKIEFVIALACMAGMFAALNDDAMMFSYVMFIAMFAFISAAVTRLGMREHLLRTSPETFTKNRVSEE